MVLKIQGFDDIRLCPGWVQYFWSVILCDGPDRTEYNEVEDIQVFIFDIKETDIEYYPNLENIKVVKIWELPDGPVMYEAHTK
jgi:hypothetical protein